MAITSVLSKLLARSEILFPAILLGGWAIGGKPGLFIAGIAVVILTIRGLVDGDYPNEFLLAFLFVCWCTLLFGAVGLLVSIVLVLAGGFLWLLANLG